MYIISGRVLLKWIRKALRQQDKGHGFQMFISEDHLKKDTEQFDMEEHDSKRP